MSFTLKGISSNEILHLIIGENIKEISAVHFGNITQLLRDV
jgi:hypothetical protein